MTATPATPAAAHVAHSNYSFVYGKSKILSTRKERHQFPKCLIILLCQKLILNIHNGTHSHTRRAHSRLFRDLEYFRRVSRDWCVAWGRSDDNGMRLWSRAKCSHIINDKIASQPASPGRHRWTSCFIFGLNANVHKKEHAVGVRTRTHNVDTIMYN